MIQYITFSDEQIEKLFLDKLKPTRTPTKASKGLIDRAVCKSVARMMVAKR